MIATSAAYLHVARLEKVLIVHLWTEWFLQILALVFIPLDFRKGATVGGTSHASDSIYVESLNSDFLEMHPYIVFFLKCCCTMLI